MIIHFIIWVITVCFIAHIGITAIGTTLIGVITHGIPMVLDLDMVPIGPQAGAGTPGVDTEVSIVALAIPIMPVAGMDIATMAIGMGIMPE